jgi:hypothetical protein
MVMMKLKGWWQPKNTTPPTVGTILEKMTGKEVRVTVRVRISTQKGLPDPIHCRVSVISKTINRRKRITVRIR